MNLRREQALTVTAWLALTAAAVWAGVELYPYWLQFACLIAAAASLRMALHTLRHHIGRVSPGRRFGGGRAVIRLKQPATGENPDRVTQNLTAALDPPPSVLEISLTGIRTLGTDDAQVLFTVLRTAHERGVPVLVTHANSHVRTALHSMGLDRFFSYPDDRPRSKEHRGEQL
ncbi:MULTISPECIES: STAS domain-containing protein [Streptomyces]|uniref:STAS domain-containing protein n=1 Tax=Streptomyces atratus TaxID=1893 RepID=A0A1K1X7C3_STRAR|nr:MULTISPECIES: STAS domain-containing protein [Streptomyces]MCX4393226.1 STAS domain-containing protein [Streptomyces sp. NBC_01767]MCX4849021.1 STAS domain-containing protein [Streptomyces sp. NBC_00893]SFX45562.1 hypothetical protein SAMN02787144_1003160 [Streptomyces atratus]